MRLLLRCPALSSSRWSLLAPLAPAAAHPRHDHPSGPDGDYARPRASRPG